MTSAAFRRLALSLDGAIEGAHMNHPDFRAGGRIFATLSQDGTRGMVKLSPDVQREYLQRHPSMFEPASGAWGRQGCTMIRLAEADAGVVTGAIAQAWRQAVKAPATKPKTRRT